MPVNSPTSEVQRVRVIAFTTQVMCEQSAVLQHEVTPAFIDHGKQNGRLCTPEAPPELTRRVFERRQCSVQDSTSRRRAEFPSDAGFGRPSLFHVRRTAACGQD